MASSGLFGHQSVKPRQDNFAHSAAKVQARVSALCALACESTTSPPSISPLHLVHPSLAPSGLRLEAAPERGAARMVSMVRSRGPQAGLAPAVPDVAFHTARGARIRFLWVANPEHRACQFMRFPNPCRVWCPWQTTLQNMGFPCMYLGFPFFWPHLSCCLG
ncbi:hypothetical protein BT67DRAFT_252816 [Trichocladium antarcticum]|uniref:Uncharacterized protein n=1 Tax=Trichocladium antarcticum TaxID=1450529 RepID=A0AAN6UBD4_9PEZI|nr:hypothetical protein BT67DRAFT_252816 [Trichocladium antarcticum]